EGSGHSHDLVRAPRGPRHERPHPGDAARAHRGGDGCSGRDAGAGAAGRARAGLLSVESWVASKGRQVGTLAGLLLLCPLLTFLSPYFLTVSNLRNVLEQTAINAVIAVGMTFVIISGGIDLSVGSMVAFAGVLLASALQAPLPVGLAIAVGLVAGAAGRRGDRLRLARGRPPPS